MGWIPELPIRPNKKSEKENPRNLFFLIQTSLKIFWPKKEVGKEKSREKQWKNAARAHLGQSDWVGRPTLFRGPVRFGFLCSALFRFLNQWKKVGPVNLHEKLQKIKGKTIYKNPCLVFCPRPDIRALLPW
jgi:hypothetical protein